MYQLRRRLLRYLASLICAHESGAPTGARARRSELLRQFYRGSAKSRS